MFMMGKLAIKTNLKKCKISDVNIKVNHDHDRYAFHTGHDANILLLLTMRIMAMLAHYLI